MNRPSLAILYTVAVVFCFVTVLTPFKTVADNTNFIISAGCKTEYYLIKQLVDAYENETGKKVMLGGTGNKKAMAMMEDEKIDFAFTCKPISKLSKKLNIAPEIASGWKSIPLAKDPIVVVTNKDAGVESLTVGQLTEIFKGDIKNWKDVGGADLPIVVFHITPGMESGMLMLFKEFTVGLKGELTPDAKTIKDPKSLGRMVANVSGAVTFLPLAGYQSSNGNIVAINGVKPTTETVLSGQYSLSATYYLTIDKNSTKQVQDFVSFALSDTGRQITGRNFTPIAQ